VLFFVSGFWRNRFAAVMGIGGRTVTVQHVVKEEREMIV